MPPELAMPLCPNGPPPIPLGVVLAPWPPPPPPGVVAELAVVIEAFVLLFDEVDVAAAVDLGGMWVVTPAGLVFRRTFFVLGSLLSFLYFMRRF